MKKLTQLIVFAFLFSGTAFGQLGYQLEWLSSSQSYQVSLVVNESYSTPKNMVATAQITLKVPTGGFEVGNVQNLISDVSFSPNSRHDAPAESSAHDYISFGLETLGTTKIPMVAGSTIPLFTFQNVGTCEGSVCIMKNDDEFMPPNASNANVGNNFTVLGANGNAFQTVVGDPIECSGLVGISDVEKLAAGFEIYPNPVVDDFNIDFDWTGNTEEMTVNIYDVRGQLMSFKDMDFIQGKNTLRMDAKNLTPGVFTVEVQGEELQLIIGRFIKQ